MRTASELREACKWLQGNIENPPRIGLVLGSGLGSLVNQLEEAQTLESTVIPGFPRSTVQGHAGCLVFGKLEGVDVVVQAGRVHYYEGLELEQVVFPVRLLAMTGVRGFLLTNAAGALATGLEPGDLVLIRDHINLMGQNPLRGSHHPEFGPRFPDMSEAYSRRFRDVALAAAERCGVPLAEGVYASLSGPSYETPAEIRMLGKLGVDLVGMSTVPEVLALRQMQREVLAISCVTNKAAGLSSGPLSHDEVMELGRRAEASFAGLLREMIPELARLLSP